MTHTLSAEAMQEFQQFQASAWKVGMLKDPQAQAQSFVDLTEPQEETDSPGEVIEIIDKPSRSTSVKRSRSQDESDQTHAKAKRLLPKLPRVPSLPEGTTLEGLALLL